VTEAAALHVVLLFASQIQSNERTALLQQFLDQPCKELQGELQFDMKVHREIEFVTFSSHKF
jgi:hypothetical protein